MMFDVTFTRVTPKGRRIEVTVEVDAETATLAKRHVKKYAELIRIQNGWRGYIVEKTTEMKAKLSKPEPAHEASPG